MTPRGTNAPNDWPAGAGEGDVDRPGGQAVGAVAPGDLVAEHRPDGAVDVAHGHAAAHQLAVLEGVGRHGDQVVVERLGQAVVLLGGAVARGALGQVGDVQDRREVEAGGLPVLDGRAGVEHLGVADRLLERAEAEPGQVLAHLLGDELEEVDDELGLAGEPLPQIGVLGRDADRAGVEVADPHHDAAGDHQRCRGEAELLGAEQGGDHDVAAGLQLAVGLHDDPVAQPVEQQRLLGLGEPELPRRARVLERGERAGAGAAVVARDQDDVGVRLAHARRHRADTDLADQLDVDARRRVGVLQVVDELGEVLDRVDVVVRRRRDEADARRGVPGARHPRVDLGPGQLAALPRLGALRHLDLDVVGVGEVHARHAEPPGRHLLDGRAPLGVEQAVDVLAALAGVRLRAEPVHRDRQRLVRLAWRSSRSSSPRWRTA